MNSYSLLKTYISNLPLSLLKLKMSLTELKKIIDFLVKTTKLLKILV